MSYEVLIFSEKSKGIWSKLFNIVRDAVTHAILNHTDIALCYCCRDYYINNIVDACNHCMSVNACFINQVEIEDSENTIRPFFSLLLLKLFSFVFDQKNF